MEQSYYNFQWKRQYERSAGAVCVPHKCSASDAKNLLGFKFNASSLSYRMTDDYEQNEFCKLTNEYEKFSHINLALFVLVSLLAICIMLSTLYYHLRHQKFDENHLLSSLSLTKHCQNLFSVPHDDISCLHSIRVLSMLSIVAFHSFFHRAMYPLSAPNDFELFKQSFLGKGIAAFNTSVDTFFLISGLLAMRAMLRDIEKRRFNVIAFYFHRYMRLTPALFICVIAYIALMKFLVAHFPYAFNHALVEPCETFWWSALLHTQIYTNHRQMVSTRTLSATLHSLRAHNFNKFMYVPSVWSQHGICRLSSRCFCFCRSSSYPRGVGCAAISFTFSSCLSLHRRSLPLCRAIKMDILLRRL